MRDRANKWGREVPGKTPVEPPWVTAETNGTAHGPVCQKPPQGACDQGPGLSVEPPPGEPEAARGCLYRPGNQHRFTPIYRFLWFFRG